MMNARARSFIFLAARSAIRRMAIFCFHLRLGERYRRQLLAMNSYLRLVKSSDRYCLYRWSGNLPAQRDRVALQLLCLEMSESMGNHDSNVVGAGRVC